jgi:uncharacterized protein (DUF4415 family)
MRRKTSKGRRYADDAPLTSGELRTARPLRDVAPDLIAAIKKARGRPSGRHKESVHLSLDVDLVQAMRRTGRGWQTRANALLRNSMKLPSERGRDGVGQH